MTEKLTGKIEPEFDPIDKMLNDSCTTINSQKLAKLISDEMNA